MGGKKLIIIGAGDLGREIFYSALTQDGSKGDCRWIPIAFVDEDKDKIGKHLEEIQIVSFEQVTAFANTDVYFILGIGFPEPRIMLCKKLLTLIPNAQFGVVMHSAAVIMPRTKIDPGVYIGPHGTISTGCHIHSHVVLNFNVSVGHDCVFGENSVISPGCLLSGRTEVGQHSFLGSGAVTYPGVKIGNHCIVSANVCVRNNVEDNHRVFMEPKARIAPV